MERKKFSLSLERGRHKKILTGTVFEGRGDNNWGAVLRMKRFTDFLDCYKSMDCQKKRM